MRCAVRSRLPRTPSRPPPRATAPRLALRDDASPRAERGRAPARSRERPRSPGAGDGRFPHPRHERHLGRPRARRGGARRVLPPVLRAEERDLGRPVPRIEVRPRRLRPRRPGPAGLLRGTNADADARARARGPALARLEATPAVRDLPVRTRASHFPPTTATASSRSPPSCRGRRRASARSRARATSCSRISR